MKVLAILAVVALCYTTGVSARKCFQCEHLADANNNHIGGEESCENLKKPDSDHKGECKFSASTSQLLSEAAKNVSTSLRSIRLLSPDAQSDEITPLADDGCFVLYYEGNRSTFGVQKWTARGCLRVEGMDFPDKCDTKKLSEWQSDANKDLWANLVYNTGIGNGFISSTSAKACGCKKDNCNSGQAVVASVYVSIAAFLFHFVYSKF